MAATRIPPDAEMWQGLLRKHPGLDPNAQMMELLLAIQVNSLSFDDFIQQLRAEEFPEDVHEVKSMKSMDDGVNVPACTRMASHKRVQSGRVPTKHCPRYMVSM